MSHSESYTKAGEELLKKFVADGKMVLSTDVVNTVFMACLFTTDEVDRAEMGNGFIEVHGVTINVGFHPGRVEQHKELIMHLLMQLPDTFRKSVGGGWSFSQACYDNDGHQWTSFHKSMDELFCLGIAIGVVEFQLPRELWSSLPNGLPYVVINDDNAPRVKVDCPLAEPCERDGDMCADCSTPVGDTEDGLTSEEIADIDADLADEDFGDLEEDDDDDEGGDPEDMLVDKTKYERFLEQELSKFDDSTDTPFRIAVSSNFNGGDYAYGSHTAIQEYGDTTIGYATSEEEAERLLRQAYMEQNTRNEAYEVGKDLLIPEKVEAVGPTKQFGVRTILSVTTGRLLTESEGPNDNGIGRMYNLLGWMTDDSPFTHQLKRFADDCMPTLLACFPELVLAGSEASLKKLDNWISQFVNAAEPPPGVVKGDAEDGIKMWIAELQILFPEIKSVYDVPKINKNLKKGHEVKNPMDELVAMRGGSKEGIIPVIVPEVVRRFTRAQIRKIRKHISHIRAILDRQDGCVLSSNGVMFTVYAEDLSHIKLYNRRSVALDASEYMMQERLLRLIEEGLSS